METEPRVLATVGEGSKSFVEIERWSRRENGSRWNITDIKWIEAEKGKDLAPEVRVLMYLYFKQLTEEFPDHLWRFVCMRLERNNG